MGAAMLGGTSDKEEDKSASLPEEFSDSSDMDVSQEKRLKKRKKLGVG